MTSCNATLTVLLEGDDCDSAVLKTVNCAWSTGHPSSKHRDNMSLPSVQWDDDAPGATPHKDPAPTYQLYENPSGDWVVRADGLWAAIFHVDRHPDPKGAAEFEALYLNGGGGPILAARAVLQRMHEAEAKRDEYHEAWLKCNEKATPLIAALDLAKGERREALAARDGARFGRDKARAEADRYRKALEQIRTTTSQIADQPEHDLHPETTAFTARYWLASGIECIARDALRQP